MKVFNEAKTEELTGYDLEQGYLKEDVLIVHIPAVEEVQAVTHREIIRECPETGGKEVRTIVDVPYRAAVPEHDEEEKILVYVPYTSEELAEIAAKKEYRANKKRLAALTEDFIQDLAGEVVPNMAERREEFMRLHDAVRAYEGKEPREKEEEV